MKNLIEISIKESRKGSLNDFLFQNGFKVFRETGPTRNYPMTNFIHYVEYEGIMYNRPTGSNEEILNKLNKIINKL